MEGKGDKPRHLHQSIIFREGAFKECASLNGDLTGWDLSNVATMTEFMISMPEDEKAEVLKSIKELDKGE